MSRKLIAFSSLTLGLYLIIITLVPSAALESQLNVNLSPDLNELTQLTNSNTIYLPLIIDDLPPIIPNTTKVLTEETTDELIDISNDGTVFTFGAMTPELLALEIGDVMVSDATAVAPYGFLREIINVTSSGGQVMVTTESATLEDAIQQGSVSTRGQLRPANIANGSMAHGVSLMRPTTPQADEFIYNLLDVVLYDLDGDLNTTDDQVTANGSIILQTSYDFSVTVEDWQIENLSFTRNDVETAELIIEANFEKSVNEVKQIAQHTFTPITMQVGWVPIVFVPQLEVNVGVDGNLHVNVTTSVTQQATLQTGLAYSNGEWQPTSNLSNTFTYVPPTLSATLDVRGYTEAQFRLMLYGVVGPYAEVEPYLLLEADINTSPWWVLYAGVDVPIGVKIEVLGKSLANYETIPIAYKKVLAQASASGSISGNITNGTNPLNNIRIEAHEFQDDGLSFLLVATDYSNNGGYYELTGLEDGVYIVRFYDESGIYLSEYHDNTRNRGEATWHTITGGNTVTNIDAVLDISSHISGRVMDATNNTPLTNIPVSVADGVESGNAATDGNGYYTIHDIPSGNYIVSFSSMYGPRIYMPQYYDHVPDYESATPVSVGQGSTVTNINASLLEGGYITGQVTAMDGATPLENISVRISDYAYGGWRPGYVILTDADGWYQFNGLIPGNYRLTFFDAAGVYMQEHYDDATDFNQATDIDVEAGQTTANINASLMMTDQGQ